MHLSCNIEVHLQRKEGVGLKSLNSLAQAQCYTLYQMARGWKESVTHGSCTANHFLKHFSTFYFILQAETELHSIKPEECRTRRSGDHHLGARLTHIVTLMGSDWGCLSDHHYQILLVRFFNQVILFYFILAL